MMVNYQLPSGVWVMGEDLGEGLALRSCDAFYFLVDHVIEGMAQTGKTLRGTEKKTTIRQARAQLHADMRKPIGAGLFERKQADGQHVIENAEGKLIGKTDGGNAPASAKCAECGHHRNEHSGIAPTNCCRSCHCTMFVDGGNAPAPVNVMAPDPDRILKHCMHALSHGFDPDALPPAPRCAECGCKPAAVYFGQHSCEGTPPAPKCAECGSATIETRAGERQCISGHCGRQPVPIERMHEVIEELRPMLRHHDSRISMSDVFLCVVGRFGAVGRALCEGESPRAELLHLAAAAVHRMKAGEALDQIAKERQRQRDKWGTGPITADTGGAMAILAEEIGEVADDIAYDKDPSVELVQVAACCVRWIEELPA